VPVFIKRCIAAVELRGEACLACTLMGRTHACMHSHSSFCKKVLWFLLGNAHIHACTCTQNTLTQQDIRYKCYDMTLTQQVFRYKCHDMTLTQPDIRYKCHDMRLTQQVIRYKCHDMTLTQQVIRCKCHDITLTQQDIDTSAMIRHCHCQTSDRNAVTRH